jgi:sec-independent protein translocase protein TatB
MPSFQDSVVIFFIALIIFGPKKLPELARQLGKLMAEFRRASNEFRMQMEDELRIAEQAEQQKKIAAMVPPDTSENTIAPPANAESATVLPIDPYEVHPHDQSHNQSQEPQDSSHDRSHDFEQPHEESAPLPIATSGELNMMPPSTGLPVASASVSHAFDSIPRAPEPAQPPVEPAAEAPVHG